MFQKNETIKSSIRLTSTGAPDMTYLLDLNDDCLLEIFSVKSLDSMDLCSLAETCLRFQQICRRIFPKDLKINIRGDRICVEFRNRVGNNEPLRHIETILKNFGTVVQRISFSSLTASTEVRSNYLLNLIAKYCVGTLRSLTLDDIKISDVLAFKMQPIFKRLELLDIRFGSIDFGNSFTECDSLIDLRVYAVRNCNTILRHTFPRLRRFSYQDHHTEINGYLHSFVSRHKSLTTLDLNITPMDERSLHLIISSCKRCEGLRKLGLNVGTRNVSALFSLQTLNSLQCLMVRNCKDFRFVPVLTQLRELHLHNCSLPSDHNQFVNQFGQIIKLHIIQTIQTPMPGSFDMIVTVIRLLRNLEELTVGDEPWNGFALDEKRFSEIVGIIKGRPNALLLRCKCDFVVKSCDENRNLKLLELDDQVFFEPNFI